MRRYLAATMMAASLCGSHAAAQDALVTFLVPRLVPANIEHVELTDGVLRLRPQARLVTNDIHLVAIATVCPHLVKRPETKGLREIRVVNKFEHGFVFESPELCADIAKAPVGSAEYKALILGHTHSSGGSAR